MYLSEVECQFFAFKNVSVSTSGLTRARRDASENTTGVELVLEGLFKDSSFVSGVHLSFQTVRWFSHSTVDCLFDFFGSFAAQSSGFFGSFLVGSSFCGVLFLSWLFVFLFGRFVLLFGLLLLLFGLLLLLF